MRKVALYTALASVVGVVSFGAVGCNGQTNAGTPTGETTGTTGATGATANLEGAISIDGSSTVEPILAAAAEEFVKSNSRVEPTVSASGTGGGFKKFCNGEIDIANASRPIKDSEIEACKAKNVEFVEIPVAFDGIAIVVNPQNTWAQDLTVEELKKIWAPNSKVDSWDDVRAGFPNEKLTLFGPGTDSGTFEYFTEEIVGEKNSSRTDYQASEDDNMLVQGVAGDKGALGYFGYAYYANNQDKLKAVSVAGVKPDPQTIANNTYKPLSRPLFMYVNREALNKPQVSGFVSFVLKQHGTLVPQSGYVVLPEPAYALAQQRMEKMTTGTDIAGLNNAIKGSATAPAGGVTKTTG